MLKYTVNMPPKPDISDLASREVTINLDAEQDVRSLQPDDATFQFLTDPGVHVECWLVDIDTSGNRSEQSESLAFVASDSVPPPVPGGMSVGKVEQVEPPPSPEGPIAPPRHR